MATQNCAELKGAPAGGSSTVVKPIEYVERKGARFAVLRDPETRSRRMIPAEPFESHWKVAKWLLESAPNHLNAYERSECKRVASCSGTFAHVNPDISKARVLKMFKHKVPGIFKESLEGANGFPTVDFILRVTAGAWKTGYPYVGVEEGKWFWPATLEHMEYFRTYAFEEGRISPLVIADIKDQVSSTYFNSQASPGLLAHYDRVFNYLEKALLGMPHSERQLQTFEKGQYLSFASKFLWHIHYSAEDRLRIVMDFLECMAKRDRDVTHNWSLGDRMILLYPRETGETVERVRAEIKEADARAQEACAKAIAARKEAEVVSNLFRAIGEGNFQGISLEGLPDDGCRGILREAVMRAMDECFAESARKRSFYLLSREHLKSVMGSEANLPEALFRDLAIREHMVAKQMELLMLMTDEEVRENAHGFAGLLTKSNMAQDPEKEPANLVEYFRLLRERLEAFKV